MDCRILVRFIGVQEDLDALWSAFMEHFPEASVEFSHFIVIEDVAKRKHEPFVGDFLKFGLAYMPSWRCPEP